MLNSSSESKPCRGFLKRFEFFYGILVQRASARGFLKKLELTFYAILVQRASARGFLKKLELTFYAILVQRASAEVS